MFKADSWTGNHIYGFKPRLQAEYTLAKKRNRLCCVLRHKSKVASISNEVIGLLEAPETWIAMFYHEQAIPTFTS